MADPSPTVKVLEHCRVSPPADTVTVSSLPLNFFDLLWLSFHPLGRVIFFDFRYSTSHFIENTVPNLKSSLSLALKHFTPLAGNLIAPCDTNSNTEFLIRYLDGDSVSVTFAECTDDHLDYFYGNHVRDANMLNAFVPQLPSATCVDILGERCSVAPLFATQVTVFPKRAICIGIRSAHAVADGSSLFHFARLWASITKQVAVADNINDLVTSEGFQIPSFDRSSIKDPHDISTMILKVLGPGLTEQVEKLLPQKEIVQDFSKTMVKATFIMTGSSIQALKSTISTKRPALTYLSSFTAVCAYLWTCFAKMRATIGGEVHNLDERQNFAFTMDCRARLDPPLPASYFGNCLALCLGSQTGRVLVGDEGLVAAAEVLGNTISVKLKEGPLHGSDKWIEDFAGTMNGEWCIGIAGSPKLDYYNNIDFGWGKPLKFEFVEEPLSMSRCKDSSADLEIGIVLPKNEMDVFSTIFAQGLQSLDR